MRHSPTAAAAAMALFASFGCSRGETAGSTAATASQTASGLADVTAVSVTGDADSYTFAVTLASPDTGCDRYADWWEVLSADGDLLYRRILAHSHVDEQPFTRSGGPVNVAATAEVVVRAHMSVGGYGGAVMRGTPGGGFTTATDIDASFAADAANAEPQPGDCAF